MAKVSGLQALLLVQMAIIGVLKHALSCQVVEPFERMIRS
jgi:hypothetical protein